METQNRTLLTIIGVATLLVAIVGASFAYFSATGNSTQQITTGKLMLTATSSVADATTIKPTTWESATLADTNDDVAKVKLAVVTNGTTINTGVYNVYLKTTGIALNSDETLVGGTLEDIKWALYNDSNKSTALNTGNFGSGDFPEGITDNSKVNNDDISIPKGTNTDNLTLYIWIENDESATQDKLQDLTITAKLTAVASQQATPRN